MRIITPEEIEQVAWEAGRWVGLQQGVTACKNVGEPVCWPAEQTLAGRRVGHQSAAGLALVRICTLTHPPRLTRRGDLTAYLRCAPRLGQPSLDLIRCA